MAISPQKTTISNPTWNDLANPWYCLALGFGSGLTKIAPGTAGTILALILFYLLAWASGYLSQPFPLWIHATALISITWIATIACEKMSTKLGTHDHGSIVIDEFVGFWLTMLAVPITWYWLLIAFILFRLFDIFKPFPINWIDKNIQGGWGIMIDDLVAAVYSASVLQLIILL